MSVSVSVSASWNASLTEQNSPNEVDVYAAVNTAKTAKPIEMTFGNKLAWASRNHSYIRWDYGGTHMGAPWRIQLNGQKAAVQAVGAITVTTSGKSLNIPSSSFIYYNAVMCAC